MLLLYTRRRYKHRVGGFHFLLHNRRYIIRRRTSFAVLRNTIMGINV